MPVSRRSRAAAVALAALFVTGQAALFTHQLFVPHQVCAEHGGELIHIESHRASPATGESPVVARAQWQGAAHGHEHCTVFTSRREDAVAPPEPPKVAAAVITVTALPAVEAAHSIPREVLLRLAPKNSPPV